MGQSASKKLREAAGRGKTEQVRRLHAKGASLETTDNDVQTPLCIAARNGRETTVRVLADGLVLATNRVS